VLLIGAVLLRIFFRNLLLVYVYMFMCTCFVQAVFNKSEVQSKFRTLPQARKRVRHIKSVGVLITYLCAKRHTHISNSSLAIGMKPTVKCHFTFYKTSDSVFSRSIRCIIFGRSK
jgi:hypothetical protein